MSPKPFEMFLMPKSTWIFVSYKGLLSVYCENSDSGYTIKNFLILD